MDYRRNLSLIRVSLGTVTVLGLDLVTLTEKPTTAYLQTFYDGRCSANCRFCAQAREATADVYRVARALYPPYPVDRVFKALTEAYKKKKIGRVCFQTVNYSGMLEDLKWLVKKVRSTSKIPISASTHAIPRQELEELKNVGVTTMVIPLDACSKKVFDEVKGVNAKGPYQWETHWKALEEALKIFGPGNVGTHLILGMGETEFEATQIFQKLYEKKIHCGLFAFTPIHGTSMQNLQKPAVEDYRVLQLTHYLIFDGKITLKDVVFDEKKRVVGFNLEKKKLIQTIELGKPFQTTGCPNCNRPYATESPTEVYNYPRPLTSQEIRIVKKQLAKRLDLSK
ncbi:radical SAM protein [Candidatus Bathyarchaeota archaeon]|nr:MAG: radical SAM protein [Candidatus Bathyarchaeota archaeon]